MTAGTVLHRTHLPLTVWFWAIYLCATDKRGISAKALARQLELSYESSWYLLVRIRSTMQDCDQNYMLEGLIEMDEVYLGAPKRGKTRGRGTERKKMVVAVSKTENDCPLFLRLQIIPDVTTASLQSVINDSVKTGSTIECDGLKAIPDWIMFLSMPQIMKPEISSGVMLRLATSRHFWAHTTEATVIISLI